MPSITIPLNFSFPISAESAAEQSRLVDALAKLNERAEHVDAKVAELNAIPPGEWSTSHASTAARVRDMRLELLRDELAIRERANGLFDQAFGDDLAAARRAAHQTLEDLKAKAVAHLLAGGWAHPGFDRIGSPIPGIDDHVVYRNLAVREAAAVSNGFSYVSGIDLRKANSDAIRAANEKMATMKSKAMSAA